MIPERKIDFDYPRYPGERYDYSFDFSIMYNFERDENNKIISHTYNEKFHSIREDPNVYTYFIYNNYRFHRIVGDDEVDLLGYDTCWYDDYKNAIQYVGEVANDRPHGRGSVLYENGDRYDGERKFGKKEGRGKLTKYDGSIIKGIWKDNEYLGDDSEYKAKEEIQQKKEDSRWYKEHIRLKDKIENNKAWHDFSWMFDDNRYTEEVIQQAYDDLIEMLTYYGIDYNKAKEKADLYLKNGKHRK